MIWGGIQESELLIVCCFWFSDLEFLRWVLIVPDAATAGGSSPKLCADRVCPGLMLPFHWWLLYRNAHSIYSLLFGELHAQWLEVDLDVLEKFIYNVVIFPPDSCRTWWTQLNVDPWCVLLCRPMARFTTWKELCLLSLFPHEENYRGGTDVPVKINCDLEEERLFEKALLWPL